MFEFDDDQAFSFSPSHRFHTENINTELLEDTDKNIQVVPQTCSVGTQIDEPVFSPKAGKSHLFHSF